MWEGHSETLTIGVVLHLSPRRSLPLFKVTSQQIRVAFKSPLPASDHPLHYFYASSYSMTHPPPQPSSEKSAAEMALLDAWFSVEVISAFWDHRRCPESSEAATGFERVEAKGSLILF